MKDARNPEMLMSHLDRIDMETISQRLQRVRILIEAANNFHLREGHSEISLGPDAILTFSQSVNGTKMNCPDYDGIRWLKMSEFACENTPSVETLDGCLAVIDRWLSHLSLPLHFLSTSGNYERRLETMPAYDMAMEAGRIAQVHRPAPEAHVVMPLPNPYHWENPRISIGPGRQIYLNDQLAAELYKDIPSTIELSFRESLGYDFNKPAEHVFAIGEINNPIDRMRTISSTAHVKHPLVTEKRNPVKVRKK